MLNIKVQICGLLILLLLFVFYKTSRSLQLYREKIFYNVLCFIMVSLLFDILSVIMICYMDKIPNILVKTVCKLYICSLVWATCSAFIYVLADVYTENKHKRARNIIVGIVLLESLLVVMLPIHIVSKETIVFTYGLSVTFVYVFAAINIIAILSLAVMYRKKMNARRRFAVILWMAIWLISALIQFFNNTLLIVGFASVLGVLILFAFIENPEANHDSRLGCFNQFALVEYLKQLLEKKIDFEILDISFKNTSNVDENFNDMTELARKILQLIRADKDVFAFTNITNGLLLTSTETNRLLDIADKIENYFSDVTEYQRQTRMILTTHTSSFSDVDDVMHFISFAQMEFEKCKEVFFKADEEMIEKYHRQFEIQREITDALAEDRVEVFLQPIYSNNEKSFTSAEALVRIRKTDGSLLSPGMFIPVAEASGQILNLGERVLHKVCEFLKNTDATENGIHYIEVNLSVIQCERQNLAERLISIVEEYQVDPGQINLEITETASISDRRILIENMKKLIDYGFTFSLDDFGKGESNLMYVVEMPVSIVKLDYDMSKAFFTSPKAKHVVRAVIGMAHEMGLKLVAEGIETEEELGKMKVERIDYIQGYYYSRPVPMDEFLNFIRSKNEGSNKAGYY